MTNLLLHSLNGLLVFLLARGLLGSPFAALASAVVYVAHPVQTEAVVSIVGRSELLAGTLFFSGLLAFRKGRIGLASLAYFAATLAKESAIMFPAIALLDTALRLQPEDRHISKVVQLARRFAVVAGTGIAYLGLRFYVLGGLGIPTAGQYLHGTLTWFQRWLTSGRVFLQYFRLLVAPVEIASDYDFNSIPLANMRDWDAWLGLGIVAAVIVLAVRSAKARPALTFAILFFFIVLLPVSNWVTPIALLMAERFLYTPVFGFALVVGLIWSGIPEQGVRRLLAGGFVAVAALLCIGHNYTWQDTLTFHRNAVRIVPNNARARLGYGFALLRVDKVSDAKEQFEAGLRIMPESAPLLAGLASATMRLEGSCESVRPILRRALTSDPAQWHSLWILGDCFMMEHNVEQAEKSYRLAVQKADFPDAKLLFSWARILEESGEIPTAISAYQRAALIDPTDVGIQFRLRQLSAAVSHN